MKKRLCFLAILLLLGAILWWLGRRNHEPVILAKTTQVPSMAQPAPADAKPDSSQPPPPASVSVTPPGFNKTASVAEPDANRAELKATITSLIGLIESNDYAGYYLQEVMVPQRLAKNYQDYVQTFAKINQDRFSQGQPVLPVPSFDEYQDNLRKTIQTMSITPQDQSVLQAVLAVLKSIENTKPKFNDVGDEAEYAVDPVLLTVLPGNLQRVIFHKENGQWYEGAKP